MIQFDRPKFDEAIHYVISRCEPGSLGAVKLNKALYYTDMISFALSGAPMFGASYKKRPFGPTSDNVLFSLRDLEKSGRIRTATEDYFGYKKTRYEALIPYRNERMSKQEIELLDDVIEFVCNRNSARTISELSHDASWDMVEFGEEIPYLTALNLFPNPVSVETLEWATERGKDIEASGSHKDAVDISDYRDFRSRVLSQMG